MAVRTWVTPPGRLPVKARVARLPGHVRTDKSVDKSVVSNSFYFYPKIWGRFPFWRSYFSDGLVQPPTRFGFEITMVESTHPSPLLRGAGLFNSDRFRDPVLPRGLALERTGENAVERNAGGIFANGLGKRSGKLLGQKAYFQWIFVSFREGNVLEHLVFFLMAQGNYDVWWACLNPPHMEDCFTCQIVINRIPCMKIGRNP